MYNNFFRVKWAHFDYVDKENFPEVYNILYGDQIINVVTTQDEYNWEMEDMVDMITNLLNRTYSDVQNVHIKYIETIGVGSIW